MARRDSFDSDGDSYTDIRRRELGKAIGVGTLTLGMLSGTGMAVSASGDDGGIQTADVVVDDSIQTAIEQAAPGETIEIPSGIYTEAITIDKSISLIAPDGATLEGTELDATTAITITAGEVTITGLEIRGYDGVGIDIEDAPVTLEDITVLETTGVGIRSAVSFDGEIDIVESVVDGTGDTGIELDIGIATLSETLVENNADSGIDITADSATITDSSAEDNGQAGVRIDADDSTISNTQSRNNDEYGVTIAADSVLVEDSSLSGNGARGLNIEDASTVNIESVESSGDAGGLRIDGEGVFDRTIELENVSTNASSDDLFGVWIEEASGNDEVTIRNSEATDNTNSGFDITAGTVTLENIEAADNEDPTGLVSGEGDGAVVTADSVTVRDSSFDRNEEHGLDIAAESVVVTDCASSGNDERGLNIERADDVDITTLESVSDDGAVRIDGEEAFDRIIDIDNLSATGSSGDRFGVWIDAAGGDDEVTIRNSEASDNTNNGFDITAGTVTLDAIEATDNVAPGGFSSNDGDGVNIDADTISIENSRLTANEGAGFRVTGDSVTVRESSIEMNTGIGCVFETISDAGTITQSSITGNDGGAVSNAEDNPVIDASENWWGDPDGPAEDDIIGEVNIEPVLAVPPGEELHESGVSEELFDAVDQDNSGQLTRGEIRDAVQGFIRNQEVDGVSITRRDVRTLVEFFIRQ